MGMDAQLARKLNDYTHEEMSYSGNNITYHDGFEDVSIGSWDGTRWACIKDIWSEWFWWLKQDTFHVNEFVMYSRPSDLTEARAVLDAADFEDDKTLAYELLDIFEKNPDVYIAFMN